MYTDSKPLSIGNYKSNNAFDIYVQTAYPFEYKGAQ